MDFGMASVAAITVIAYVIGLTVKASGINNKWIPILCALCGGVLGIVGMFVMPDFPAGDIITAAARSTISPSASPSAVTSMSCVSPMPLPTMKSTCSTIMPPMPSGFMTTCALWQRVPPKVFATISASLLSIPMPW